MKTFQQPLSAEEEACCIKHMQEEGSERAREARALLIERNLRLVAHIAKKYQNLDEDMEDLISIGTIGLIKAVNTFDAAKKIRLSSYASKCIENELLMMIRGRKKKSKEVSLYEPIGTDKEGNEISLLDIIENEQTDILESMERRRNTKKLGELLYTRLDDREREIICMRYGILLPGKPEHGGCLPVLIGCSDEVTQREIGAMLGISRSYPAVIIGIKIQSPCKERPGMPSVGMPGLCLSQQNIRTVCFLLLFLFTTTENAHRTGVT